MGETGRPLRQVREIEHLTIAMADGCRLAARLWLPVDAEDDPVPAILEYLPYRKRDGTALRDQSLHPYLAARGYACLRVDIRGNGESEGLMTDEYTAQELSDGVAVIEWAARQSWCSGQVGMMGISWGGFNALQVAALRPAPLKAIITVCSTDDRYEDDIHYLGGCLLNDNLTWSSQMLGYSSRPPDPALVGARWKDLWLRRLEAMPLLAAEWLRHPHRDAYWQHGSVCQNYDDIRAAVFAVGGWADAYPRAIPRLLRGLRAPALGLIGPWVHAYPHLAHPAPTLDFGGEILRWWDHWLKDRATGIMAEPRLRAYMLDSLRPATEVRHWPGRWVAEPVWPSPKIEMTPWYLNPDGLSPAPGAQQELSLCSPLTTGINCGSYCPGMRLGEEFPGDQGEEDGASLVFDGPALDQAVEILGAPKVELRIASDRPVAQVTARLLDLHPDGAATRVSFMPFNLTHRSGHEYPVPLEPGTYYDLGFALKDVAYRFPAGHRLRLALSSAYWPMVWPAPEVATLRIATGASRLLLPIRPARAERSPVLVPAGVPPDPGVDVLRRAGGRRSIERAANGGGLTLHTFDDFGAQRFRAHGLEVGSTVRQSFSIAPHDPLSAEARAAWTHTVGRGIWRTRTESESRMWSDERTFHLEARLQAYEDETLVTERTWRETIPRDLV